MIIVLAVLQILAGAAIVFFIIKGIVDLIRTFVRAKSSGIIKACIKPLALIIPAASTCLMTAVIIWNFSYASKARETMAEWQQLKGTENVEYYTEYYNDILSRRGGTEITDFDKFVDEQIGICQGDVDRYTYVGIFLAGFTLMMLTTVLDRIFYLTGDGIYTRILKKPEEFYVKRRDGKLDVYFKLPQTDPKPLISFRSTPDNLAKLGRFIEWDEKAETEEADNGSEAGTL